MKAIDRFMSKVVVADSGCWEWQAYKNKQGYGIFRVNGENVRAHRWSYKHHVGEIPAGMFVCHKCDNTSCTNPNHLFVGTNKDNVDDMTSKGRQAKGEQQYTSKLNKDAVLLIKRFLQRHPTKRGIHGGTCVFLASWFDVSEGAISHINKGFSWRHIK